VNIPLDEGQENETGEEFASPAIGKTWTAELGVGTGLLLASPLILLLIVMLAFPLIRLATIALGKPDGLGNIQKYFESGVHVRVMLTTFVDSAIVAIICVVLGGVLAWSLRTSTSKFMLGLLWSSMLLPFLMGTVTKLYAMTVMLQSHGIVNSTLTSLKVIQNPLDLLYNQIAVVIGMTYQMLPFAVLPLLAGFYTINTDLVKAAESLGASRLRAIAGTVLPLSIPSLFASFTIVYIISVGFFLTPVILGGATAPFTASIIAQDVFTFYDLTSAAISALVLLAGSLVVIAIAYLLVGRDRLTKAVAV
jgi:ABC-type spermidine/putrescine transport system permease subunit I